MSIRCIHRVFINQAVLNGLLFIGLILGSACQGPPVQSQTVSNQAPHFSNYPDVLNLRGIPDSASDRSVFVFADQGAWFGYALPGQQQPELAGSFSGPFLMTHDNGVWASPVLSQLEILDTKTGTVLDLSEVQLKESHSFPGRLRQVIETQNPRLSITAELIFANARTALQQLNIENLSPGEPIQLQLRWRGSLFENQATFTQTEQGVRIDFADHETIGLIAPLPAKAFQPIIQDNTYTLTSAKKTLSTGDQWTLNLTHTFCFSEKELAYQAAQLAVITADPTVAFTTNEDHWNTALEAILSRLEPPFSDNSHERLAVKCLQTLITNWRSPAGFLAHDGLFPSYNYEWFHGFWSWDSWKHAVALAYFDPELAQNQIRAMYDFQDKMGMIADCVYRDTLIENHNWRDTKPPLSAWAIWRVYEQSKDTAFLVELWPKVQRYHQWWYQYRDHDQNGLCEYGSTDGTLIAAKWESGMDNAVRFDETHLVQNNEHAWSMNRESVDLNAYLFAEKKHLALIANTLGQADAARQFTEEAEILKRQIQTVFYDEESGWFYDIDLEEKQQLMAFGAEGWIPLWATAAKPEQAARLRQTMLDSTKFATYIPFPTLAADHPGFDPNGSYWRGPVWLDQAYFAITGLRNYGYHKEAEQLTLQLTNHMVGLKDNDLPIRENYHPLTGEGLESNHFSWSAAHLLLLLWNE